MGYTEKYSSSSPAVASYPYSDIAEGTAISTFLGYATQDSTFPTTSYDHHLTTLTPYSVVVTSGGGFSLSPTVPYELDFDADAFQLPKDIKGDGLLNVTWRNTNSSGNGTAFLFAKLRKWDGTTEYEIAEASGAIQTNATDATRIEALPINNIPLTHFNSGDVLRLTVGLQGISTGAGNLAYIAHDPQGRTDTVFSGALVSTTKLIFTCPFRIHT